MVNVFPYPNKVIPNTKKNEREFIMKSKKTIHQRLYDWLQVLKDEFKSYESKDYDFQDGLSQCKTRKGCFVYGKIIMVEQILDKEI